MISKNTEKPFRSLKNMISAHLRLILCILSFGFTLGITLLHASTGGGDPEAGKNWIGFGWRAFNFLVLAGLLYWLMAGKVKMMLKPPCRG
jgi:hypothetical protein